MQIIELSSQARNKHITLGLSYDEVRDIANGLYHISKQLPEYQEIYNKAKIAFDMIKEGNIQPETVDNITKVRHPEDAKANEKDWIYQIGNSKNKQIETIFTRDEKTAFDALSCVERDYLYRYKTENGFIDGYRIKQEIYNSETQTWE